MFTVHDLRNPHHADRTTHDAQLDVLVRAADALITLTPGAAAEIRRRWGRDAHVVPHPHVVDFADHAGRRGRPGPTRRRPVPRRPARQERARGHGPAGGAAGPGRDRPRAAGRRPAGQRAPRAADRADARTTERRGCRPAAGRDRHVDLRVHDYFADDAAFFDYLASLDVSVLPYRFGTHSGWLEACRDLGTTVVAPSCGYYAEQGPVLSYVMDEDRFDADSLAAAVTKAYDDTPAPRRHGGRAPTAARGDRRCPRGALPVGDGGGLTCASVSSRPAATRSPSPSPADSRRGPTRW